MAHRLKDREPIKLQQLLHGYADGHRLIAGSLSLKASDARLALVWSDSSGAAARLPDGGYLTGYPLPEARMYVLARTWPAPEMTRPGCVWTHSLLVDFEDLARVNHLSSLCMLFRRPVDDVNVHYTSALDVRLTPNVHTLTRDERLLAGQLLSALYLRPESCVVAGRPADADADEVVLRIWSQQWPRLRRSFRFSTFSVEDRCLEGNGFDLQLVSHERRTPPRFHSMVIADDGRNVIEGMEWLSTALDELATGRSDLQDFLRRFGGDIVGGRGAFPSLCRLYALVHRTDRGVAALSDAMTILESGFASDQARGLRGAVVSAALASGAWRDPPSMEFVIQNRRLVDQQLMERVAHSLGPAILHANPRALLAFDNADPIDAALLSHSLARSDESGLLAGLRDVPELTKVALAYRPWLVASPEFWSIRHPSEEKIIQRLTDDRALAARAMDAMIMANREDLAGHAVIVFGEMAVLESVSRAAQLGAPWAVTTPWILAATRNRRVLEAFLRTSPLLTWEVLERLADAVGPDSADWYGEDPWVKALHVARERGGDPRSAVAALLLARAMKRRETEGVGAALLVFSTVYQMLAANRLPEKYWRWIESQLGWSFGWSSSSKADRVLVKICDLIVECQFDPVALISSIPDDRVFQHVILAMASSHSGMRYLKNAVWRLRGWEANARRLGVLQDAIRDEPESR
jgi:hypothetical protein